MSRTTRRGKPERDHVYDKHVGTGSFRKLNRDKKAKLRMQRKQRKVRMQIMTNKSNAMSDKSDVVTLNPTEGAELIVGLYNAGAYQRVPIFLGPPGIGKTSFVRSAVKQLRELHGDNFYYQEINPTMPAEEVGGIPDLVRKEGEPTRTDYAMPVWFPRKSDNPDLCGIICLDDAMQGDKQMQTTLANLIQARNLRNHELPDGIMIVATGNRAEDNAGSNRMLTHLADRMTPFHIEADPQAWINDFAIPNGVDPRIVAYIQQNPDRLNMFDPKKQKSPTSRTWAALSSRMDYIDSLVGTKNHDKFAQAIITGELGMAEGSVFWSYCGMWDKTPDLDAILADPVNASIDYPVDIRYATAVALAKKMDVQTFENAITYVNRLSTDLGAMVVKMGSQFNPELVETETFVNWAANNQELLHGIASN